jgi:cell division protein FtsI/penicillin-binding protein 2
MSTLILGIVLLLIAVLTIFIGMVKIFRYERYENQKRNGNTDIATTQVDRQQGYNPFGNDNSP